MPSAFTGVIVKWNIDTANRIVKTCFTFAATVMLSAPTFLFAVKLTTFSPNASRPFAASASARGPLISRAEYARTRSSSPVSSAKNTHWMNASGDMRVSRSSGCSCSRMAVDSAFEEVVDELVWDDGAGDWRMLVNTVLSAARNVPRRVRNRPQAVK